MTHSPSLTHRKFASLWSKAWPKAIFTVAWGNALSFIHKPSHDSGTLAQYLRRVIGTDYLPILHGATNVRRNRCRTDRN